MPQINYSDILKTSWGTAWRKKYLWLFGFFASLEIMVVVSQLSDYFPEKDEDKVKMAKTAISYAIARPVFFSAMAFIMLVAIIIFWAIRTWGRAALIKTADLEDQEISSSFSAGSLAGKKYFWKVFMINFLVSVFLVGLAVVLFVPAVFVANYAGKGFGLTMIAAAFLILILLAIVASFIKTYALIYGVVSELSVIDSMERAYQIFRDNIKSSLVMLALLTLISLAMGMVFNFIEFFLTPAYLISGRLFVILSAKIGLGLAIGFKYLINTAILFLFLSVFGVFYQISWIRFFRQIAGRKTTEAEKEKEIEMEKKEVPEPEGANLNSAEK